VNENSCVTHTHSALNSRYYVLYRLKKLKFLDASPVTEKERKEANRVGPYMITVKPDESQYKQSVKDVQPVDNSLPQLPADLQPEGKGSARFGVSNYVSFIISMNILLLVFVSKK
jgi:hypothetical protein